MCSVGKDHVHLKGLNRRRGETLSPGRDVLERLYLVERLSYAGIAELYGVWKTTVGDWLRTEGIPARGTSEATKLGMVGKDMRWSDEHRENAAAARRGENNYNWQGGSEKYSEGITGWRWHRRRRECYARDNWTCQNCGVHCTNKRDAKRVPSNKIQAHHILPRRLGGGDELDNLVTLCASCHTTAERALTQGEH